MLGRSGFSRCYILSSGFIVGLLAGSAAMAQDAAADIQGYPQGLMGALAGIEHGNLIGITFFFGLLIFAIVTAVLHIRARATWNRLDIQSRREIEVQRARADRAETLLLSEPQVLAVWAGPDEDPMLVGGIAEIEVSCNALHGLSFAGQIDAAEARMIEAQVELLQARGEAFRRVSRVASGSFIEAEGRAIGGKAVVRIRDVTGDRLELAQITERYRRTSDEISTVRALLDEGPLPVWLRDANEKLIWVNKAYARAVDAADETQALSRGTELLDRPARDEALRTRRSGQPFAKRVPAVVGGARRMLDIFDIPSVRGSAGLAIDVSELEGVRAELDRQMQAHAGTLDQLATAVAIFNADKRLTFYNAAYRALWQLDSAFLDEKPLDGEILDRLRVLRRLPEQADFRAWRNKLHEAYRALEAAEQWWHLPGGQTLRVVTTPNPTGGVTYLFEDVTERLDLETRFNAMARMQGETLDNLKEGVAAFGSDGRLRLFNPAFASVWRLSPNDLDERPHIDEVIARCVLLFRDETAWGQLKSAVTSLEEARHGMSQRLTRVDGSVVDVATVPLPDGGTLATFTDVTDSVNFENALVEKNDALEEASKLKNDFVQHVSYELRSPLTNIIGFVQLLADGAAGPLSEKQRQYAGYIMTSSDALLAIINNILDLATIDAGVMTLELGEVDVREAMEAAAEGVQHRLAESGVRLEMKAGPSIGAFRADSKRVRQILFNLLSNAIGFSDEGGVVYLSAERRKAEMIFRVEDHGRGISPEMRERVFERFESHASGTDHRGAGLGLSIVRSFVELHGGRVDLSSEEGRGTIISAHFPITATAQREAAE